MPIRRVVFILSALITLSVTSLQAQYLFKQSQLIPVTENNDTLKYAWAGGLNNPQFNKMDVNDDATEDLVVFDKTGDKLLTFTHNGVSGSTDYTYEPELANQFPIYEGIDSPFVEHWLLLRDYNCDGVKDIFTSIPGSIVVFFGQKDIDGNLSFVYQGPLVYNSTSGIINVYCSAVDIPTIRDINSDGDLDVLTFNIFGGSMDLFENISQEVTGTCGDTLLSEQADDCWGNFFESGIAKAVDTLDSCGFLNYYPKMGAPRHVGSTSDVFDEDGNGVMDLLIGDVSFPNITRLYNGGTPDSARVFNYNQDTLFPSYNVSVDQRIFPAPFILDIDNDGLDDLMVAPNAPKQSFNVRASWFYKNVGTADTFQFELQTDSFLVNEMVDLGEGAYPVFFDHNNDGLMDLVVGNYGYWNNGVKFDGALALLENVGTATDPAFELVDRDYAGFTANAYGLNAVAPAFGDLDGDNDKDMVVGDKDGELYYFENTAAAGQPANFVLTTVEYGGIDVGQYAKPFIFDVNDDGLNDLLVGAKGGNVYYHENAGTATNADFASTATNPQFGEIDVRKPGFINGYSAPVITRLDTSSQLYVVVGAETGVVKVYRFSQGKIYTGGFTKVFDRYSMIDDGERLAPTVADLNDDGFMEMVTGNYRGGIALYTQNDSIVSDVPELVADFGVQLAPNPAQQYINVTIDADKNLGALQLEVFSVMGEKLRDMQLPSSGVTRRVTQLYTADLSSGVYLLRLTANGQSVTRKFMVQ